MLKIFRKILGIKYLINTATGEVHKIKNITGACGIKNMSKKNKWYVTERKYQEILTSSYYLKLFKLNGCVHCFKETDTD